MENRIPPIDEQSSFHGRMTTIVVFSVLIALAIAAWLLEPDYMAHVPVSVGVCVLDSVSSNETLLAFADFVREKGGGDIRWKYLPPGRSPSGCDFYLASPLQIAGKTAAGEMDLALLATVDGARSHSKGVVIRRSTPSGDEVSSCRVIFPHPWSTAGYLSAYAALLEKGILCGENELDISFGRCFQSEEEIVHGVLNGKYIAGGLSSDIFTALKARIPGIADELTISCTGLPVTGMVMTSDTSVDPWKRSGFLTRLPLITGQTGGLLRSRLRAIGIGGFTTPADPEMDLLENFPDSLLTGIHDYRT